MQTSRGKDRYRSTGKLDLHKLLVNFATYFASREENGEWWGYDTNLGNQRRQFQTTEKMIQKWALENLPLHKDPQEETGIAQAHQAVGYNSAIKEAIDNLTKGASDADQ